MFHTIPASQLDIPWNSTVLFRDVRKPLPFQNGSISCIYASHLFEHLYLEQAKSLLKECFRALEPGGILRVVVPNLRAIVLEYIGERPFGPPQPKQEDEGAADRLNRRLSLRPPQPIEGNLLYKLYTTLNDFHSHKWMYDPDSMTDRFRWAGFEEIQEMAFHQSRISGINEIEQAGRVLQGEGICIEGVKPR